MALCAQLAGAGRWNRRLGPGDNDDVGVERNSRIQPGTAMRNFLLNGYNGDLGDRIIGL